MSRTMIQASAVIFYFALLFSYPAISLAEKQKKTPEVIVYQVKEENVNQQIKAIGNLLARDSIDVSSGISEFISKLHFKEGQWVKKGQLLVKFNSTEQKALLEEAKVLEDEAKRQYNRVKKVVGIGSVTISLVDERYREWKTAVAKRTYIEAQVADRSIYAPFSGRVGFRYFSPGAFAPAGATITTLDDTREMKLIALVPSSYLSELKTGQNVTIQSAAFPRKTFSGKVGVIAPRLDADLKMVQLQINIPNRTNLLKPNMMVAADIDLPVKKVLRIPNSAIQLIGEKSYVYRLKPNEINLHQVERVEIQSGDRDFDKTEILSGLKEGDIVVSQGVMRMTYAKRAKIKGYEGQQTQAELLSTSEKKAP